MDDMRLEPGTVLAEKYRLGSVLGTGGMGTVYQAEHLALKAPVAVKVIDRHVGEGDVALARFMREAQSAASLRSPHVVQILDYGMEGDRPFMVMEMLEGESLADRLKRIGRLTPAETYRVISHVARAVSKAHEADIIHRDLKPDNIFLVHNEGDEIAKVLDFGVAKVESTQLDGEGHTRTGSLLGTPYYMSPEQAQGNKAIDPRSDLWALGVIAFECMTGKRPFSSDGLGDLVLQICIRDIPIPSSVVPVPPGFDAWFKKACGREPADRFQTARDLAESLRPALDLGSEASGSIPESKWASAASIPARLSAQSFAATIGGDTTERDADPAGALLSQDGRATRVDQGAVSKGERRDLGDSHWEVVPHGQKEKSSPANLIPATVDDESSGGSSVAFVAIIALLLGGSVVFGMNKLGLGPFKQLRDRLSGTKTIQVESSKTPGTLDKTKSLTDQQKPDAPDEKPDPNAPEGAPSGTPEVDVPPGTEEGTDPAKAEDPLGLIEEDAEKALSERAKEEAEKDQAEKDRGISSKDQSPTEDGAGPEPKLPDSLAPAPAPPPPPQ